MNLKERISRFTVPVLNKLARDMKYPVGLYSEMTFKHRLLFWVVVLLVASALVGVSMIIASLLFTVFIALWEAAPGLVIFVVLVALAANGLAWVVKDRTGQ